MKIAFFDSNRYDRAAFESINPSFGHDISYLDVKLTEDTAKLAVGSKAVCAFVNDRLDAGTLKRMADLGVELIALRSAGYNHIDLKAAA